MVGAYPGTIIGYSRHQTFATEEQLNVEKGQVTFFEHLKLIVYSETQMNDSVTAL